MGTEVKPQTQEPQTPEQPPARRQQRVHTASCAAVTACAVCTLPCTLSISTAAASLVVVMAPLTLPLPPPALSNASTPPAASPHYCACLLSCLPHIQ